MDRTWVVPTDRVVEIPVGDGHRLWGCGRYRAVVVRIVEGGRRGRKVRWSWRAWDVVSPSLGGSGFGEKGEAGGMLEAIGLALESLTRGCGVPWQETTP